MEKTDIKSLNLKELEELLLTMGEKKFRAKQIYTWLHGKLAASWEDMTDISKKLREQLQENCELTTLQKVEVQESKLDGTRKYLFALSDGNMVESVLMRYKHGNSVCISSQVGCRMGCRFCASTLDGLVRGLKPSEMLDQIYRIQEDIGERVSNVVVMGTGEPLDNYDNLLKFILLLTDENGLHISQRNLTVSTCGIVPNMRRLAEEKLQITLALSLHASSQEKRLELMPVANKYAIEDVIEACSYYFEQTGRRITFEYSLVGGVNDTDMDARQLAGLIKGMNCHVNLIPVNPIKERNYVQSDSMVISNFKNKLEKYGINVTIRREMGRDIDGACGQLRKRFLSHTERQAIIMKAFSKTDKGKKREMNQDYVYTSEVQVGNLPNLCILADGMGGHNAGDYASRYTVETIVEAIQKDTGKEPVSIIQNAIQQANEAILQQAKTDIDLEGMGTTVVAATMLGNELYVANVGDSRLYVVGEEIKQITRDHSYVQEMVQRGELDKKDARIHPDRNIITRAVGGTAPLEIDFFEVELKESERILMCSDGLTDMIEDEEILEILQQSKTTAEGIERLIEAANENGGNDNITVVVIEPVSDEVKTC